jgi:hypothetical protein
MKHKQKSKRINVRPLKVFEQYISEYNWSPVLNASCINDKVSKFLEITTEMVDAFFPLKPVKIQVDDKPFINGRIKQLIQKRDKAYQLGRVDQPKLLRNLIVAEIRKAKRVFYERNIKPFHNQNSKKWWTNVKRIVGNKRQNFDLSDPLSDAPMNDKQTADYINSFFTSLTKEYPKVKAKWLSFGSQDPLLPITTESVAKKLSNINVNKAPGPFDPNMKVIKSFAEHFAVPLPDIYNQSFRCKTFPEIWKISNICSVPKSSPCSLVEELRPIALTSTFSKLHESYVVEWILNDTNDKFSESQFGGLAGMSAVLALIFQLHKWYLAMENNKRIVRITFLVFRKAFDLIDHNRLLQNFNDIGIRPGLCVK